MTGTARKLESSEDVSLLIATYQEILMRQVQAAFDKQELDEQTYFYFFQEECTEETEAGVYEHYQQLFNHLAEYHRQKLRERILKGAEMLDSMGKQDPRYPKYMKLYDSLVEKLKNSENTGG